MAKCSISRINSRSYESSALLPSAFSQVFHASDIFIQVNWEQVRCAEPVLQFVDERHWQGYDLKPPSMCLRNATTCGQGDVPIYSVEAETVADIQVPFM
jgi:hypothetical protein